MQYPGLYNKVQNNTLLPQDPQQNQIYDNKIFFCLNHYSFTAMCESLLVAGHYNWVLII